VNKLNNSQVIGENPEWQRTSDNSARIQCRCLHGYEAAKHA
jgi:hypothetical protein